VTRVPAPAFHKILTPVAGPKEKRRILTERTLALWTHCHLW